MRIFAKRCYCPSHANQPKQKESNMEQLGKILIVDDNKDVLFALNLLLEPYAEKIKVITGPERLEHFMTTFQPDIVLLDMNFSRDVVSGQEGFDCLKLILRIDPQAVVIFMTAYSDTDKAVRAIKAGATDFIPKPWEKEKLLATLSSGMKLRRSQCEVTLLKEQVEALSDGNGTDERIIGESPAMRTVFDTVEKLSDTDANILILGENGTGKDVIARLLCRHSPRAGRPFVTIDLGSIPEQLFESELFGYEKAPLPMPAKPKPAAWKWPRAVRSSWTRLATSPCPCRPNCLQPSRNAASCAWEARKALPSTCASFVPPMPISATW